MKKLNQNGSLVAPLAISVTLLVAALAFGSWAFMSRQDYKNNSEEKVSAAVKDAIKQEGLRKDAEFVEAEKSPLKTFNSKSETIGNLTFSYPKSWSAYATTTDNGGKLFSAYFYPDFIPNLTGTNFPLRVEVTDSSYSDELEQYTQNSVETGEMTASAFRATKVPSVLGAKLTGKLDEKKDGTLVLLPLRDKTIKIWTENNDYLNDFNNSVLPSINFAP